MPRLNGNGPESKGSGIGKHRKAGQTEIKNFLKR